MKSFLAETVKDIFNTHGNFGHLIFVLPNKRSGIYLKKYIANHLKNPILTPRIWSIDELVSEISGLQKASNLTLLFELFEAQAYQPQSRPNAFEAFSNWAATVLADFNEIDSYLADSSALFAYLTAAKRLQQWGVHQNEATPLITEGLRFWENLQPTYQKLNSSLASRGVAYQGAIYRKANEHLEDFLQRHQDLHFAFIGFNALTGAEEGIIQRLLDHGNASIYWDIDHYFVTDTLHEAGHFVRNYFDNWRYFQKVPPKGVSKAFLTDKSIEIVGLPKQIAQAKYIGQIVEDICSANVSENIALVLPDESLLPAILNSLPQTIDQVNITMGLPLQSSGVYNFYDAIIDLHLQPTTKGWHHSQVLNLLSNPFLALLLQDKRGNGAHLLRDHIKKSNLIYITKEDITGVINDPLHVLGFLFPMSAISCKSFIDDSLKLIEELGNALGASVHNTIEIHATFLLFQVVNQLQPLLQHKGIVSNMKSLKIIFNELAKTEKIDFRGEPVGGLQIMGMLESRNIDFDTVIVASVNEGILPAGKTYSSHIPHDIKKEYGLPTNKDKDAVYAYHFYRLLQRAKTIYLTYNSEPDALLGNERSRFVAQLLTDHNTNKFVTHSQVTPNIPVSRPIERKIYKTEQLQLQLKNLLISGISPSALSIYIRNPYYFYKKYILRLDELEQVEEDMAASTFGTIIHDTLEELYLPFLGETLNEKDLLGLKQTLPQTIRRNFKKFYTDKEIAQGKNNLTLHVIKRYLENFLDYDARRAARKVVQLLAIEEKQSIALAKSGGTIPVLLAGKIDRVEMVNGQLQILDYKTGRVAKSDLELISLDEFTSEKHAKAFQLLCYSLLLKKKIQKAPIIAGIVPIKQAQQGILHFATKPSQRSPQKNTQIDAELILNFENIVNEIVEEMLNPNLPFEDKGTATLF